MGIYFKNVTAHASAVIARSSSDAAISSSEIEIVAPRNGARNDNPGAFLWRYKQLLKNRFVILNTFALLRINSVKNAIIYIADKNRNFSLPFKMILYSTLPLFLFLVLFPFVTLAQSPDPAPVNKVLTNFLTLLTLIIQILILCALVVFGWGIIKLIFASNDPKKIEQAKYIILWGIIGIFALASMSGILAFIKKYLGVPDNSPIPVPTFTTFLASPRV